MVAATKPGWSIFLGLARETGLRPETARKQGILSADPARDHLDTYAPMFGEPNPRKNLQLVSTSQPRRDQVTYRYQQTYKDIPILAGEIFLNLTTEGGLLSLSGELSPELDLSVTPKLSAAEARQKVEDLFAFSYQIDNEQVEISTPQLWIFDERLLAPSDRPAELVWRCEASAPHLPINELVLVNAETGAISLHFNQIDTSWVQETDNLTMVEQNASEHNFEQSDPEIVDHHNTNPQTAQPQAGTPLMDTPTTWYVSITGTDANDCLSPASPCASINGAVNKTDFLDGDTVMIAEGTYTGTSDFVVYLEKDATIIGGWNSDFSLQNGYSTLDGENVRGGLSNNQYRDWEFTINLSQPCLYQRRSRMVYLLKFISP